MEQVEYLCTYPAHTLFGLVDPGRFLRSPRAMLFRNHSLGSVPGPFDHSWADKSTDHSPAVSTLFFFFSLSPPSFFFIFLLILWRRPLRTYLLYMSCPCSFGYLEPPRKLEIAVGCLWVAPL